MYLELVYTLCGASRVLMRHMYVEPTRNSSAFHTTEPLPCDDASSLIACGEPPTCM